MIIDLSSALALSRVCAPSIAPETLLSVVSVESGFDPLIIGVNGPQPRAIRSATKIQAVRVATALLASGANLDLGLGQVNSRNLGWLDLSVEDAFDPCRNLAAAAKILSSAYATAVRAGRDEQLALQTALSLYNSGDQRRGFANGYVAKTVKAAAHLVPAIAPVGSSALSSPARVPGAPSDKAAPQTPAWDVFGKASAREPSFVFSPISAAGGSQ